MRVTTGVKDTAGNALSSQYETSSGFTPADLIAPTVYSIYPVDNQSSVLVSDNISLTFSEIMDNSSITTNTDNTSCYGSFQVSSDNFSTCVLMSSSPSISNSAKTFTFDPSDNLSYDNKYNIKLTTETKDENGVSLESAYETSFNTIDNSLVAYYPFNGNAEDITSNGRDLTVTGDTSLTFGKDNSSNSAYYFDGNGDYLE
ncbi:MAG: Ig-like domain-containing protein, partial [Candidatus Marinimicrobia bacterium]|nr:Ig-like domain-containing protein [Candidatus Neomarinimicrobiota bacterium]